jgi:hypothetical protein
MATDCDYWLAGLREGDEVWAALRDPDTMRFTRIVRCVYDQPYESTPGAHYVKEPGYGGYIDLIVDGQQLHEGRKEAEDWSAWYEAHFDAQPTPQPVVCAFPPPDETEKT